MCLKRDEELEEIQDDLLKRLISCMHEIYWLKTPWNRWNYGVKRNDCTRATPYNYRAL